MKIKASFIIEIEDFLISEGQAHDAMYHIIRTPVLAARMKAAMTEQNHREQFWFDALVEAEFAIEIE